MHHEQAAADLRWFWREASGDLGLSSNFMAVVSRIEGATPAGNTGEPDVRRLEAAARARRISATLGGMAPDAIRVLRLAFGSPDGDLRMVALSTTECEDAYRRSRTRRPPAEWFERLSISARKGDDLERRRTWARIQASAQLALSRALDAYVSTRVHLDAEPQSQP